MCLLGNLRCWIASGFMARSFCSVIALAMTSLQERHCEGNDKCIDGDIRPEAIQQRKFPIDSYQFAFHYLLCYNKNNRNVYSR